MSVIRFPVERARVPEAKALPMNEFCSHLIPTRNVDSDPRRCQCALYDGRRCEGVALYWHVGGVYLCEIHATDWRTECAKRRAEARP